jgi:hypothetical protein
MTIPSDPDNALRRVEAGTLRAGAAYEAGLVEFSGGEMTGPLVELVEDFAQAHGAHVTWTAGSEESLVGALEAGELDIAVGGMTTDTPWLDRAGLTRGYPEIPGSGGRDIVLMVPLGENRLLFELETYLDAAVGQ